LYIRESPAEERRVDLRIARNRAILHALRFGLRLSELCHLTLANIDLRNKEGKVIGTWR